MIHENINTLMWNNKVYHKKCIGLIKLLFSMAIKFKISIKPNLYVPKSVFSIYIYSGYFLDLHILKNQTKYSWASFSFQITPINLCSSFPGFPKFEVFFQVLPDYSVMFSVRHRFNPKLAIFKLLAWLLASKFHVKDLAILWDFVMAIILWDPLKLKCNICQIFYEVT